MIERECLLPDPAQPLAFALGHGRVIESRNQADRGAGFTSYAPLPVTTKAVIGAGLDIHAERFIARAAVALRAWHALLSGAVRLDTDAARREVNHRMHLRCKRR